MKKTSWDGEGCESCLGLGSGGDCFRVGCQARVGLGATLTCWSCLPEACDRSLLRCTRHRRQGELDRWSNWSLRNVTGKSLQHTLCAACGGSCQSDWSPQQVWVGKLRNTSAWCPPGRMHCWVVWRYSPSPYVVLCAPVLGRVTFK